MSAIHTAELFAPVRDRLAAVELRLRETVAGQHCALTAATERLLNAGGKRVRPAMCLMTAGVFGADAERSIALAAGVEMAHTATLVHDDLIDVASLRRGVPTLNADWPADAIVLAGDYLFARAAGLVARTRHADVIDLFAQTLTTIVNGEIRQRFSGKGCISRDEYYERIYAKTATMFVLSTQAAAMLGEAPPPAQKALGEFGHHVGMAFQIVDDVLDFVGTPDQIGKPVGSDLRQGVFTLPAIYYVQAHPNDPDVKALCNGKAGDTSTVQRVIAAVRASGAVGQALLEARALEARAQLALESLSPSPYRAALSAVSRYIVARDL
ncbi:MAG: polyprenyl synthetase family protein [Thermoflexales bacterium]|nr:polyprenyl synthetase family protein [Thermoflexales bacterium]